MCEAAGFNAIIIETVGVGQSETLVHSMVDFFLLLMLAGAGDELQGIKRGIMEMADALVITKADGENELKAQLASRQYANAMHLFPPKSSQWIVPSFTCSAYTKSNIHKVYEVILSFDNQTKLNGWFNHHRQLQNKYWLLETLKEKVLGYFFNDQILNTAFKNIEQQVEKGQKSSFQGADELYNIFIQKKISDGNGI